MSIIKKFIFLSIFIPIISVSNSFAEDLKKVGKFKDWEVMVVSESSGKVCFAQSTPVLQAPKKNKRDARLFITFRPGEKISNEISATAGYEFNKNNTVLATSGNNKFKFDIAFFRGVNESKKSYFAIDDIRVSGFFDIQSILICLSKIYE